LAEMQAKYLSVLVVPRFWNLFVLKGQEGLPAPGRPPRISSGKERLLDYNRNFGSGLSF